MLMSEAKELSFEISNQAKKHRILLIEPLGLKYGLDAAQTYTLTIFGDETFQMFLGDDEDNIYLEIEGDVSFRVFSEGEEIESGYNLSFENGSSEEDSFECP